MNSVYRYRRCNERTIAELMNDEVSASKPITFNDPYDVSFGCNWDEIYISLSKNRKIRVKIYQDSIRFLKHKNLSDFTSYDDYQNYTNNLYNLFWSENNKSTVLYFIKRDVDRLIKRYREFFCVASLSKELNKEVMWSHYAGNGTGFVIEYDIDELNDITKGYLKKLDRLSFSTKPDDSLFVIKSVEYKKTRYDATKLIYEFYRRNSLKSKQSIYGYNDEQGLLLDFTFSKNDNPKENFNNILLVKHIDWEYERELRLVLPFQHENEWDYDSGIIHKHTIVGKCKPKAIYIGEFTPKSNKIQLMLCALKKNIRIFQMTSSNDINNFGLKPVLIEEDDIKKEIDAIAN